MQKFKKNQKVIFTLNGESVEGYVQFYKQGFYRILTDQSYKSGEVNIFGIGGDIIEPIAHWIPENDIAFLYPLAYHDD